MTHDLKIQKEYFEEIITGRKKFEIRKNDRDFKIDDYLFLREYDELNRTGRHIVVQVSYIFYGGLFGVDKDYCIMSITIKCFICGKESNSEFICRKCAEELVYSDNQNN